MTIIYDGLDPLFQILGYLFAALTAYWLGSEIVATWDDEDDTTVPETATIHAVTDPVHSNTLASSDQVQEIAALSVVNASSDYEEGWLKQRVEAVLTANRDDGDTLLTNAIASLKAAFSSEIQASDWKPVTTRLLRKLCPILGISGLSSKPKVEMIAAVITYFQEPQAKPV